MFFRVTADQYLQPLPAYATAAIRLAGGGDHSARLATVIIASLNVGLIFLCARRLFDSRLASVLAALLLLVTPAHITFGRSGADALFSIPFVLLWLMLMQRFWATDTVASIVGAGAALGAGIYANRASPLTMGFLLIVSIIALLAGGRRWRSLALITAGFGALLLPAVVWFALHPEMYPDTFGRWVIHLAHVRNPLDGVRAFLNWNTLGNRASLYWGFFNPAWLFFENMLLLVMLPLLLIGIATMRRVLPRHAAILVAGGALAAPLAGSSFGAPHYAADALAFLPFAMLLMTAGALRLQQRFRS
jgi:4-amino-4-deoxy-L-arabinose transferase-like glycosyltransferase